MCDPKLIDDYNEAKEEQKKATAELLQVLEAKLKDHPQTLELVRVESAQVKANGSS